MGNVASSGGRQVMLSAERKLLGCLSCPSPACRHRELRNGAELAWGDQARHPMVLTPWSCSKPEMRTKFSVFQEGVEELQEFCKGMAFFFFNDNVN